MRDDSPADLPTKAVKSPASPHRRWLGMAILGLGGLSIAAWAVGRIWIESGEDPQRIWDEARAALSTGRFDQAEASLGRLARRRPPTLADRLLLAQVARERGQLDRAIAALDGFPEAAPGAALIERTRGMLEFERDRGRAAESALLRALALDPKLAEARRDLVNIYTVELRGRELSAQFHALSGLGTLNFGELYLWCLGRRLDVGPAELAEKLRRMLHNDPDDRFARLALAEDLRRLGRLAEAESALAPLSDADPDARAARGRLALDRGEAERAELLLAEGPPDHPALARHRGRLALARGDAAAVGHYRRVLASEPDDRDALFGLGQALRLAGQAEAAQPYLQAARDRDRLEWLVENARALSLRDDPKALAAIGDACRKVGHLPEAHAWYRLALSRDPLDGDLQKRLFELDQAVLHAIPGDDHGPSKH
jgi:tetratricopeptide (TPR) repeat protein